jgi:energy-converting hydrogenase Eha subunit E
LGGPLAYYGGVPFGALTYNNPLIFNLMVTGAVWAATTPLLLYAVLKINETFTLDN